MRVTGAEAPDPKRKEDDMHAKLGFTAAMFGIGLLAAPAIAADEDDYKAFSQAKTSLTQAIQAAEKAQGGQARAVEAGFEREDGKPQYDIKVMSGDKVMTYYIDAATGQATKSEEQGVLADLFGVDKVDPVRLTGAQTTLSQAIGIAEQNTNGKAIEAKVDEESSGVRYEVTVLVGDDTRNVEVDGTSGQVIRAER
jgi:uncharacterized membrane protein YkoI